MPPENIDVPVSEDNGNVPVDAPSQVSPQLPAVEEAPDGNAAPVVPQEQQPASEPAAPESQLFELPDGRKVDAETLTREWKENFLPDYTRKSQILAANQQGQGQNPPISNPSDDPYADPDYRPQSYAEIIAEAERRAVLAFEAKQQQEIASRQALEDQVNIQITEIKTVDPNLNENALFLHATKYGFRDLKAAYQNMKDMTELAKNVQKQTANNIQRRAQEPVAANPGQSNGTLPDRSHFATAQEYLRSINK